MELGGLAGEAKDAGFGLGYSCSNLIDDSGACGATSKGNCGDVAWRFVCCGTLSRSDEDGVGPKMGGTSIVASSFLDVSGVAKIPESASSLPNRSCTRGGPVLGVKKLVVFISEVNESGSSFIGVAASSASPADFTGSWGRCGKGC